jgi:hypothetical protein
MDDVIASDDIIGVRASGERITIKVRIGRPYRKDSEPETWACPVTMEPLYPRVGDVVGDSSFQAMCLTARLALYLLNGFKEDGGRLLFEDGTDVPLDAYGLAHQQSDARSSEA